jgi:hypothetical protein
MNTRVQIPQKPAAAASHFTRAPLRAPQPKGASSGWAGVQGPHAEGRNRNMALPPRALAEPRFGHDFSRVEVQADQRASEAASALNSLAYMAFKSPLDSLPEAGRDSNPASLDRDGKSPCGASLRDYCPVRSRSGATGCQGCSRAAERASARNAVTSRFFRKGER